MWCYRWNWLFHQICGATWRNFSWQQTWELHLINISQSKCLLYVVVVFLSTKRAIDFIFFEIVQFLLINEVFPNITDNHKITNGWMSDKFWQLLFKIWMTYISWFRIKPLVYRIIKIYWRYNKRRWNHQLSKWIIKLLGCA